MEALVGCVVLVAAGVALGLAASGSGAEAARPASGASTASLATAQTPTTAPTTTQTQEATGPPPGTVLFRDRFSRDDGYWDLDEGPVHLHVRGGAYHLVARNAPYDTVTPRDMQPAPSAAVDFRVRGRPSGRVGVGLGVGNEQEFDAVVNPASGKFTLRAWHGDVADDLRMGVSRAGAGAGWKRVRLECLVTESGTRLTLRVNGRVVARALAERAAGPLSTLDVIVGPAADAVLDDVVVRAL